MHWSKPASARRCIIFIEIIASGSCSSLRGHISRLGIIDRLFTGFAAENKRIDTLRAVVKFAAQAVGALVILFIIFGMPTQTTTVLGFAGAGLTVAMKDFIVAFFGWFILMGRNGIRVGDWVEINGVSGEVVESRTAQNGAARNRQLDRLRPSHRPPRLLRQQLRHRRTLLQLHHIRPVDVGRTESFIPPGQDPYAVIDGIQKLVEHETATNAGKAEAEWRETTTKYRAKTLSAVPGINVQPTGGGIEVRMRYITRAYERHEARKRLYEAVVELLHGKREMVKA